MRKGLLSRLGPGRYRIEDGGSGISEGVGLWRSVPVRVNSAFFAFQCGFCDGVSAPPIYFMLLSNEYSFVLLFFYGAKIILPLVLFPVRDID